MNKEPPITPEMLLQAYAGGYFPMSMNQKARKLYWFSPAVRAVLPLDEDAFHIPRSLQKLLRKHPFTVTFNRAFEEVIRECADSRSEKRDNSWINKEIIELYTELHRRSFAHSVEVWAGEQLIGGLYGVSLGRAFFGESMFSRRTGASKIALVHLVERLQSNGYMLLDAQFENPHLVQFGFQAIPKEQYLVKLKQVILPGNGRYAG
jgi:leucyl/phenylalanyl-tRNA---protein transferase